MRPQIIEMGLADQHELDELDAVAHKHFEDPDVLVMPALQFLAWVVSRHPIDRETSWIAWQK